MYDIYFNCLLCLCILIAVTIISSIVCYFIENMKAIGKIIVLCISLLALGGCSYFSIVIYN